MATKKPAKKAPAKKAYTRRKRKNAGEPGRPPIPIDWEEVGRLCAAGCYGGSIAKQMGFTPETLYARCQKDNGEDFSAFRLRHLQIGDDALRTKQFELAMKGDRRLLVWLGINRLGQKNKHDISGSGAASAPPVINVVVQPKSDG